MAIASSAFAVASTRTVVLLLLCSTSSLAQSPSPPQRPRPFDKIFAFGDSFTDTGNTGNADGPAGFGHVSNPPYGITFFHHPTNRYSDGRLVIDFVAESLSLPYLPPYRRLLVSNATTNNNASATTSRHGVNFAVAGSTAINHDFFVKNNLSLALTPESILTQLVWFEEYLQSQEGCKGAISRGGTGEQCASSVLKDALVWVGEIGVNDYAYTFASSVPSSTVQKLAVETVTSFLDSVLKKGAKHMVVQGLPPTGCLSLALFLASENDRDELGCVKSANDQIRSHNTLLQSKLTLLRNKHPQATIVYADYWSAYRAVMKAPGSRYGFTERFNACCGRSDAPYNFSFFEGCGTASARACKKPWQYINWDGVHLTEAMYKVVSDMFLHGSFTLPPFSSLQMQMFPNPNPHNNNSTV